MNAKQNKKKPKSTGDDEETDSGVTANAKVEIIMSLLYMSKQK